MARKPKSPAASTSAASRPAEPRPVPALECVILCDHQRLKANGQIRALHPDTIAELGLVKGRDYRIATAQDRALAGLAPKAAAPKA